ncbi:hypothetical protein QYE76_032310 [Lolium multiflorum]|uniref:Ribonuclease H1 N-terminal domain-containing protein n=1 Tax=Lolium multiflorum TaxID=4521 RepID=A0AAD8QVJ0_LOLMU|nr:hypothetical protein QYE76_032310 [Lolium multiflorum]
MLIPDRNWLASYADEIDHVDLRKRLRVNSHGKLTEEIGLVLSPSNLSAQDFAVVGGMGERVMPFACFHVRTESGSNEVYHPKAGPDSFCDEFSQALVCVEHSQIPSQVPDSQPTYESKVTPLPVSDLVAQSFVLEKMCGLIQSGVRNDKGFKEVHLNVVAKGLADPSGVSVCSTQVYNHLRKWRQRWLTISRLRDLRGAQWCEDTKSIVLESEHYCGNVAESDTVNIDADKPADAPEKPTAGKRKRGAFADDELVAFTNMTVVVKEVAHAIRVNKPMGMHPDLYNAVMDMIGFTEDDLMVALSPGSWRVCQDQVNGYSNNIYRGYATLEEAQQEYLTYLQEELLEDQAIHDAVPLAQLPPEEVQALQGAPPEVRSSRVKDYIIAFLIRVIVRIVFFYWSMIVCNMPCHGNLTLFELW